MKSDMIRKKKVFFSRKIVQRRCGALKTCRKRVFGTSCVCVHDSLWFHVVYHMLCDTQIFTLFSVLLSRTTLSHSRSNAHWRKTKKNSIFFHRYLAQPFFHRLYFICLCVVCDAMMRLDSTRFDSIRFDSTSFHKVIILSHYGWSIMRFFSLLISIWVKQVEQTTVLAWLLAKCTCVYGYVTGIDKCAAWYSEAVFFPRFQYRRTKQKRNRWKKCWRINKFLDQWFELEQIAMYGWNMVNLAFWPNTRNRSKWKRMDDILREKKKCL